MAANRAAVEFAATSLLRRNPEVRQRLADLPADALLPRAPLCRAREATAAAPEPATVADHDHRLLPADREIRSAA